MSVRIIHGSTPAALADIPDGSIDACVTDPPYGIGFMGKEWDTFKPGRPTKKRPLYDDCDNPNLRGRKRSPAGSPSGVVYDESLVGHRGFQAWAETWARAVLRVLKPGAHILCCGAPRSYHHMACGIEAAGFEVRDAVLWLFGQGFPKSHNLKGDMEGWGTALKPAWEPIIMARKPIIGTVAANVRAHGTGALNIDAGRVQTDDSLRGGDASGRWPANVIHDGSDCVIAGFPIVTSGTGAVKRESSKDDHGNTGAAYGAESRAAGTPMIDYGGDTGSAARFFYCAKASRADRDDGMAGFEKKSLSWSSGEQSPGTFQSPNTDRAARNFHPTVKPTELMRYLCALVTPPGGTILDPFMGSGSTGRGAVLGGFSFIGVEREAEYVEIARARIRAIAPLFSDVGLAV